MKESELTSKLKKVKEILKENNIRMDVGGCGCCGSPSVSFEYKGEMIVDSEYDFCIDMIEETNERV